MRFLFVCLLIPLCYLPVQAAAGNTEAALASFRASGEFDAVRAEVLETTPFYGLSAYYNGVSFYRITADGPERLAPEQALTLSASEQFAAVGRFRVLLLQGDSPLELALAKDSFQVTDIADATGLVAEIVSKEVLADSGPELRYAHLWGPLAALSRGAQWLLLQTQAITGLGWGWSIVVFSVLLKCLMLPLSLYAARLQAQANAIQSQLAPRLSDIKAKYDGEEAHKRIMAAYSDLGVSTFFPLKPLGALFLQVPVWIAVFNVLGEMPQLVGQSFLWISSLAYPDAVVSLPFAIPLLGSSLSLLPVLMAMVTYVSAMSLVDSDAPLEERKRRGRNALLTALAFLLLFYPFPAAMVLYWTLSNALQWGQQRVLGRKEGE